MLCNPIDGSPPGSPIPGILQAGTLEWVAISFSNAWKWSCSVVSNSLRPHGLQPTRLLRPWDFPGKSTGVGCHRLLQIGAQWMLGCYLFHGIPTFTLPNLSVPNPDNLYYKRTVRTDFRMMHRKYIEHLCCKNHLLQHLCCKKSFHRQKNCLKKNT